MKKMSILIVILSLVFSTSLYASSNDEYAEKLNEIGILKGTENGLELDRFPTRIEGLVMFIRLLGQEENVNSGSFNHPFLDVPSWADNYVGWAYENGYANGISATEFGTENISAKSYLTFVLRALGYDDNNNDFSWSYAVEFSNKIGLISDEEAALYTSSSFLRDHVAKISYTSLSIQRKDGIKMSNYLIENGFFDKDVFNSINMISNNNIIKNHKLSNPIYEDIMGVGEFYSIYISRDNSYHVQGSSSNFGVAINDFSIKNYTNPGEWKSISAGSHHIIAIKNNGSLYSWGFNDVGQLGDGTLKTRKDLVQIGIDNNWKKISTSYAHVLAIKNDGSLWGWGFNNAGQLGNGLTQNMTSPIIIGKSNDWKIVSAGFYFSSGIKNDGSLWTWGANSAGQLGDGSLDNIYYPKQIDNEKDWSMVSSGGAHSLALKNDGTLWGWGFNLKGAVGNGKATVEERYVITPERIGVDNDWVYISAGEYNSLAIKRDGSLWEWGDSNKSDIPKRVGLDNDWVKVAAGHEVGHILALKSDGSLWAWGNNGNGQVDPNSTETKIFEPTYIGTLY
jgi:alpha-tubulin suppressor-like RCC1 family protein